MDSKQRGALVRALARLHKAEVGLKAMTSRNRVVTENDFKEVARALLLVAATVREIRIEIFEGGMPTDRKGTPHA